MDDRGDTAGEEVGINKVDRGFSIKTKARGNDKRNNDGTRVERKDVLDAKDGELGNGRNGVNRVLNRWGGGGGVSRKFVE